MATKQKRPIITTPAGVAVWPTLNAPDTKFSKPGEKGDYRTGLRLKLSDPGVTEFVAQIDELHKAALEKGKEEWAEAKKAAAKKGSKLDWKANPVPYKVCVDEEGNELPEVQFNFKMAAFIKPKDKEGWDQRPSLFDAKGVTLTGKIPKIGGGSTIKVAFDAVPYYVPTSVGGAGLTLRLRGVQILKLVQFGGHTAASMGFGAVEDEDAFSFDPSATVEDSGETPIKSEGSAGGDDDEGF